MFVKNKHGVKDLFGDITGNRFIKRSGGDYLSSKITEGIVIHRDECPVYVPVPTLDADKEVGKLMVRTGKPSLQSGWSL